MIQQLSLGKISCEAFGSERRHSPHENFSQAICSNTSQEIQEIPLQTLSGDRLDANAIEIRNSENGLSEVATVGWFPIHPRCQNKINQNMNDII